MLAVKEPLIVCTFCVEQVLFIKDAASFRINGDTVIDRTLAFRFQNKTNKARTVESDFMSLSSYGASTKSSGVVRLLRDLDREIAGKDVLVVEDIVDTGLTLSYLKDNLAARKPASLKIATLLDKPSRRKVELVPDYRGMEIEDYFVVGYGLDFNEKGREFPFVGVVKSEG